jgi:hypothetical protein
MKEEKGGFDPRKFVAGSVGVLELASRGFGLVQGCEVSAPTLFANGATTLFGSSSGRFGVG